MALRGKLTSLNLPPAHGTLGLTLIAVAWPISWLQVYPLSEYSFFPLWLGYILVVDSLVLWRKGTSLLVRNPLGFVGMFLASVPAWWAFEGMNYFTQNWHYVGAEEYSALEYVLVASWHFSVVVPAVLETAELVGSFSFVSRLRRGPGVPVTPRFLNVFMALGLLFIFVGALWPDYAFPGIWVSLFIVLDPINYLRGRPSVLSWVGRGDWRLVLALGMGALLCGLFWEMWNYWAFPKWHYTIAFVDFAHIFEMPLLGYGGYVPFGLEVYAIYHFLRGLVGGTPDDYVRIVEVRHVQRTSAGAVEVGPED